MVQGLSGGSRVPAERVKSVSVTGTAGKLIAELLGAEFVNEVIAQGKSTIHFYPQVKTVIEMGGEDSKLILVEGDPANGDYRIVDFSMNTICAAGTGSFLDQQANRLHYTIEEFSQLALKSKTPPRIAGRCSVFAKSDMIHLQQGATPDYEIVAGLCYALARNFKSNIGKGKNIIRPVAFQGGVAANAGMRKAFFDVLELKEGEFIIPKHFASMGAIGAAFLTLEHPEKWKKFQGLDRLKEYISHLVPVEAPLDPLSLSEHHKKESPWEPLRAGGVGSKRFKDLSAVSGDIPAPLSEKRRAIKWFPDRTLRVFSLAKGSARMVRACWLKPRFSLLAESHRQRLGKG